MRYIYILLLILLIPVSGRLYVFAQEDTITIPEAPPQTEVSPETPQEPETPPTGSNETSDQIQVPAPAQNQSTIVSAQKVVTSTMSCIKVGNPAEEKPAICSQPASTGTSPINTGTAPAVEASQLSQTIKDQFGLEMRGAWDQQHLQWVYEKFYDLKQQTNFIGLVSGQPITLISGIPNQETGFVQMSQTGFYASDRDYFIGTLIHELGHTIYHNKTLAQNLQGEINNLFSRIGCVSSYSRCQGDKTENYPEVISYCLNNKAVGNINQERWLEYRNIAVGIMGTCYN